MGFITDIKDSITTYSISVGALKKMVAADLNVNPEAVTVTAKMRTTGYQRDEYEVFDGLVITVSNAKVTANSGLHYPPGVRGE